MKKTLLNTWWVLLILTVFCLQGNAFGQSNQEVTISGVVRSQDDGTTLPGVNVLLKGTTRGTVTDIDGRYTLRIPATGGTLVYTFIGFVAVEISVENQSELNVDMISDTQSLQEVVVIGYGEQKKATLTGAVSSIGSKDLIQTPVANISNALVGRLPGLIAVQSSGEPGFDQSSLKIRGIATLNAGAESDPLILVDGVQRSNLNQIDPNEIKTLSILKDASATAVFGVRGANGVILITTKTGESGKPVINYTANFGLQSPNSLPKLLGSYDYAMLRNEASVNSGQSPYFSDESLEHYNNGTDPYFHPDVDWFDMVLKDYAAQQQHNFNISGGSENVKYLISLGYFDQNGAYDVQDVQTAYSANPKYRRYNFRSNFDIDFNEAFSASIKLGSQFSDSNYPGYGAGEIFFRILNSNPMMNPGIVDGMLISGVEGLPSSSGSPLDAIVNNGFQRNFNSTVTTNVSLNHKLNFIAEGLSARGMVAYDNYYQHAVRRTKESVRDRKSTRLNSSHVRISYAVFCLKKKKGLRPAFAFRCNNRDTSHRSKSLPSFYFPCYHFLFH